MEPSPPGQWPSRFPDTARGVPLSWSHYVRLIRPEAPRPAFYQAEAIRGGRSVRQLARRGTQFFERVSASKREEALLSRAQSLSQKGNIRGLSIVELV